MARIVIDANVAVALAVPLPYSETAAKRVIEWQTSADEILAPNLWGYEVVSALRKAVTAKALSPDEADERLAFILSIGVREIAPDLELHQQALHWAARLGQGAAYDAAYLALAEKLGATFWTGDRRLANNARQTGVNWIHWIGENP